MTDGSPVSELEVAIRAVVRDEVTRLITTPTPAAPAATHAPPKPLDVIVLCVAAADCALLLLLAPSLGNPAVETFLKVVQWAGATFFVAAATWFQQQFLAFTRAVAFRVVAFAALAIVLPQKAPLLPILVPRAIDDVAELKLDAETIKDTSGRRFVTIAPHTIVTTIAGQQCAMKTQPELPLRRRDLLTDLRRQRTVLVYYQANMEFPDAAEVDKTLTITPSGGAFEQTDLDIVRASIVKKQAGRIVEGNAHRLLMAFAPGDGGLSVDLPNGAYTYEFALTSKAGDCLGRVCGTLAKALGKGCLISFELEQCKQPCPSS